MSKPKIHISWSGGKDATLALQRIIQSNRYEIVGLHTVFEAATKRVGIHEIKEDLIKAQAKSLEIPLTKLYLDKKPMAYQKLMVDFYKSLQKNGINHVMFGDIFLEDLKDFRTQLLSSAGITGIYPLWNEPSHSLVKEFNDHGFTSILCAVDSKYIESKWLGEPISDKFIRAHPHIDPSGENGEYHSLVTDGPTFNQALNVIVRERYEKDFSFKMKDEQGNEKISHDKFYYADLVLI